MKQLFKTAFIALLVFTSIVSGYYLYQQVLTSPYFQISKIEIDGNHVLQKSEVRQLVDQTIGQNIFSIDIPVVKKRLKENHWIGKTDVHRKLPDGLQVRIKERTPFARVETYRGKKLLIDQNAFVIKEIDKQEYRILPAIFSNKKIDYKIGRTLQAEELKRGIRFIEKIISLKKTNQTINFNPIFKNINLVNIGEKDRYILKSSSGDILITERDIEDNLEKLNIASRIIQKEKLNVKFIDLTFNDQVVLKLL